MNIVVCVKQVVDTEAEKRLDPSTWCLDRSVNCILNPYDEYAVEEALLIKEAAGGEVTVLCMGPDDATDAVRKALAMGADDAVLVTDPALAGSDAQATAAVLAAAIKTVPCDLALFGCRSTDGETGAVPAAVAELLDMPLLSSLSKVEVDDATVRVHRETDEGYVAYTCPTPAVISVVKGINEPRYPSMKGIMTAKKKPIAHNDVAAIGLDATGVGLAGAKTRVLSASVPPPRAAGVKIEDDGSGAQQIADFLTSAKLV
jgi:electron transfer flavoprotein beta subunit